MNAAHWQRLKNDPDVKIMAEKPNKIVFTSEREERVFVLRRFLSEDDWRQAQEQRRMLRASKAVGRHLNIPTMESAFSKEASYFLLESMERGCFEGDSDSRFVHLLEALEELHGMGWIHFDVKPEHVMWCGDRWALHDFDSAMRIGARYEERETTLAYSPPDVFRFDPAEPADDLYAAALTQYYWLNGGRLPFQWGRHDELAGWVRRHCPILPLSDRLSETQRDFFRRALARQKKERFQTAEEMRTAWEKARAPRTGE